MTLGGNRLVDQSIMVYGLCHWVNVYVELNAVPSLNCISGNETKIYIVEVLPTYGLVAFEGVTKRYFQASFSNAQTFKNPCNPFASSSIPSFVYTLCNKTVTLTNSSDIAPKPSSTILSLSSEAGRNTFFVKSSFPSPSSRESL